MRLPCRALVDWVRGPHKDEGKSIFEREKKHDMEQHVRYEMIWIYIIETDIHEIKRKKTNLKMVPQKKTFNKNVLFSNVFLNNGIILELLK